jgi:ribosomal protein S18 acetylase RimI-like enzyme
MQCGKVGLPHPDVRPSFEGELKRLYVHSSQQGKGLGRTLLSAAIDHMAERFGDAPQWIGVWSENHKAQALYASFGFHRVGAYQFSVGNTLDDEFILRRIPRA